VVYRSQLHFAGEFVLPEAAGLGLACLDPTPTSATVLFGVGDNRGIDSLSPLDWPGGALAWSPGGVGACFWAHGVRARLERLDLAPGSRLPFGFDLALRGSQALELLPTGRETRIALRSAWRSPSFSGSFLPTRRSLGPDGFAADWAVSPFARSFPQQWSGDQPPAEIGDSALGVELAVPVDGYLQTERSLKYALLVVGLTFLVCFLLELAAASRLHPMNYLLVGAALAIFYLLLLALSEQTGFATAYGLAAAAVTLLLAGYVGAVLGSFGRGAALGVTLAGSYGGLYVLLGREEYALLVGSIATLAALAATMWLTRGIDWRTAFAARAQPAGPAA
jgi:inner membrane protein